MPPGSLPGWSALILQHGAQGNARGVRSAMLPRLPGRPSAGQLDDLFGPPWTGHMGEDA
jgi:hypothetical protein